MVYGENFTFSLKEPKGWIGSIDSAAAYYSNIIFFKNLQDLKNGGAMVQVLSFTKQDENTDKDLEYDVNKYKQQYDSLKIEDFKVIHKDYKCYSNLIYVNNQFYQYIVYINPGEKFKNGVSVSMNLAKNRASKRELEAFKTIISSLWVIK